MRVAIDTSALVKRYVAIQGGEELQPIFEEATFSHLLTTSQNHGYAHIEQAFHEKAVTRAASARVIKPTSDYARFANGCAAPSTDRKNEVMVAESAAHTSMLSSAASIST